MSAYVVNRTEERGVISVTLFLSDRNYSDPELAAFAAVKSDTYGYNVSRQDDVSTAIVSFFTDPPEAA